MQLREHEGVKGKRDAYPFDPRLLKVDPTYNVRDLSTSEARAKLDELKEQIRHAGVRVPLEVRFKGTGEDNDVFIVSGHRRHKAVMELIEEGEEIKTVLVIQEPKGTNEAERALNLALSNSGEPLKPIELAHVVKRLADFGWDHEKIAERLGWKSKSSVIQHLDLLELPQDIQAAVKHGDVAATAVRKSVAAIGAEATMKIIADNKAQGKRTKPRDLPAKPKKTKAPKADKLPVPLPRQPAEPQPEPHNETVVVDAPSGELSPVSEDRHAANGGAEERVDDHMDEAPAPGPLSTSGTLPANKTLAHEASMPSNFGRTLNGFFEAVEPFAKAIDTFDFDQIQDDQVVSVEMMGVDLKRFSAAWLQAQGDRS